MFIKPIVEPLRLKFLRAAIRRVPIDHPKRVQLESDFNKCKAGFYGERSLEYYLNLLPHNNYFIFHNLRLASPPHYFQLDFLILTTKFFLILEVKNMVGELHFDDQFHQLIRTVDGQSLAFDDPILQVLNQEDQLEGWLFERKLPIIPIESLVISANAGAVIKGNHEIAKRVIRKNSLPLAIKELTDYYKEAKSVDISRIVNEINKANNAYVPNLLTTYHMSHLELLTGVQCPECQALSMKRKNGKWHCVCCNHLSIDAHIMALHDYELLVSNSITNRELRRFLQLESNTIAYKLLQAMDLSYDGVGKSRHYFLADVKREALDL